MTTNTNIHGVNRVTTDGVHFSNSNAITFTFHRAGEDFEVTLFNLPGDEAQKIDNALNRFASTQKTEEEIRADERAKVTAKLSSLLFAGEEK